jgi:nitrogen regulatory protein PII
MKLLTAVVLPDRVAPIWRVLRLFDVAGMTTFRVWRDGRRHTLVEVATSDADAPDVYRVLARIAAPSDHVRTVPIETFFAVSTGAAGLDAL